MDIVTWTWLLAALCAAAYFMAERAVARPEEPPEPLAERVRHGPTPSDRP